MDNYNFFEVDYNEDVVSWIDDNLHGSYWYICDEKSREKLIREEIELSAWAFTASFILEHSSTPLNVEHLTMIQEKDFESCNDLVLNLIDDFDLFVKDAVSSDGYGHFLSRYDGEEHKLVLDDNIYYIYCN